MPSSPWSRPRSSASRCSSRITARPSSSSRRALPGDREGEVALRYMGVHGEDAPDDLVGAGPERRHRDGEQVRLARVHLHVLLVHLLARGVQHAHRAEGGLELLGEPEAHLGGRRLDRAAHPGIRVIEKGMRAALAGSAQEHDEGDQRHADPQCHQFPKIGRPMVVGNRSSRKKWIWPRMPTFLPVRSLTGRIASTAIWKYLPAQMMPGFTVPVNWPLWPRSSGCRNSTSTTAMSWLKGLGKPMSRTKDCR